MNGLIMQVLGWAATTALAAAVGAFAAQNKKRSVRDKAMERGMRALMRAQLIELHEKYVVDGRGCSVDIKEQATSIYQAYHDLGGNGTGTHLYGELMEAHVG